MNKNNELAIYPLGGIEEIGANCTVYFYKGFVLVVDLGVAVGSLDDLTPYENARIDIVNFLLNELKYKKVYIIITHCHDDHIGGINSLPAMINIFNKNHNNDIEVIVAVSTEFNKRLIEKKSPNIKYYDLQVVGFDTEIKLTDEVSYIFHQVDHSIPESGGVLLKFGNISIFHSGDWRFNRKEGKELIKLTSLSNLKDIEDAHKGTYSYETFSKLRNKCDVIVGESTRIAVKKPYCDEGMVKKESEKVVKNIIKKGGCVYFTCFSSQIERVVNIIDIAINNGLKVSVMGKALSENLRIAAETGITQMKYFEYIKQHKNIESILSDKAEVKIVSGSQNENSSALHRIAYEKAKLTNPNEGFLGRKNTVVFSSSIIPSNRKRLEHLYKTLVRLNVDIINSETNPNIHCSGHADCDEICNMIRIISPKLVIPIHGNVSGIKRHSEIAQKILSSKKVNCKYSKAIILTKIGDDFKIDYKIIKAHNNKELVEIDYKLYDKNHKVVDERKKLILGGCIFVNYKDKKVHVVGVRLEESTIKKIIARIEKDTTKRPTSEGIRRTIGNFRGEIIII